jgi:hypothetical protein
VTLLMLAVLAAACGHRSAAPTADSSTPANSPSPGTVISIRPRECDAADGPATAPAVVALSTIAHGDVPLLVPPEQLPADVNLTQSFQYGRGMLTSAKPWDVAANERRPYRNGHTTVVQVGAISVLRSALQYASPEDALSAERISFTSRVCDNGGEVVTDARVPGALLTVQHQVASGIFLVFAIGDRRFQLTIDDQQHRLSEQPDQWPAAIATLDRLAAIELDAQLP